MNETNILSDTAREFGSNIENKHKIMESLLGLIDGIFITLDNEYKVTSINKKGLDILDSKVEQVIGKDWLLNFISKDTNDFVKSILDDLLDGNKEKVDNFENLIKTPNGQEKKIVWNYTTIENNSGEITGFIGFGRDITIFRKVEVELTERSKELRCMHQIGEIVDNNQKIEDILQKIVEILPLAWQYPEITCSRITLSEEYYVSKNFRETKWKQKADLNREESLIGNVEIFYLEEKSSIFEGPFLMEERVLIDSIAERLEKVILRKQLEKENIEYSNQLELIIDNVPGLIYYKDLDNKYLHVNQKVADAHKMSKDELEGKSLFDLYPTNEAQAYWDNDLKVIDSKKARLNIEEARESEQGRRWVNTNKIPLKNQNNEITGVLGFSFDITEQKNAEIKIKKLNQTLEILHKCSEATISAIDETVLLDEICQIIINTGEYTAIWVGLININEENASIHVISQNGFKNNFLDDLNNDLIKKNKNIELLIETFKKGKPEFYNLKGKSDNIICKNILVEMGFKSLLVVPISTLDNFYGFMNMYSMKELKTDEIEIGLFEELSNNLAIRIESIRSKIIKSKENNQEMQISIKKLKQNEGKKIHIQEVIPKKFDEIDGQIIEMLNINGRMKLVNIRDKIFVNSKIKFSDVGIAKRIKRLIEKDYIKIQANINLKEIGIITALLLLQVKDYASIKIINEKYRNCPKILFSFTTSDKYNLVFGIFSENIDSLTAFLNGCSPKINPNVIDSKLYFPTKNLFPKYSPLPYLNYETKNEITCGFHCQECILYNEKECDGCLIQKLNDS
ncbi:MAG: PAS domain-containing protein [archaeon]|nr:PAS domain-containing protein [archaeon]